MTYYLAGIALALLVTLPLAAKWQLGIRRVAVGVTGLGVVSVVLVAPWAAGPTATAATWAGTLTLSLAVLAYRFYRDPERTAPQEPGLVLSPADGEVVYVRRADAGELPVATKHGRSYSLRELTRTTLDSEDAVVIGIGMSFLDVHVNRSPIAGVVTARQHFPGLFGSLRDPRMTFENERATTVIQSAHLQVAVVQIASRLVRQIVGRVSCGDTVRAGDRIGVIRLGSQVDVVLPRRPDVEVCVRAGQRVRAGESVLAVVRAPGDVQGSPSGVGTAAT